MTAVVKIRQLMSVAWCSLLFRDIQTIQELKSHIVTQEFLSTLR